MVNMPHARLAQVRRTFKYAVVFSSALICWLVVEDVLDVKIEITKLFLSTRPTELSVDVVYENCTKIPAPPRGTTWPEEVFIHDPKIVDIRQISDTQRSRVRIERKRKDVRVGDKVHVIVELFDGYGKRKQKGGDLVRVWMREPELGASTSASVIDNQDGSYSAMLTAFWEGRPTIKAAIISPREVIAMQFRRRYICPPVLMNTAIFEHPSDPSKKEETSCNYDPQVPGYPVMCNFTSVNYGSPWYCGKPRTPGLLCHDWSKIANRNLLLTGQDNVLLSDIEKELVKLKYATRLIPRNITLTVRKSNPNVTHIQTYRKCNGINKTLSWAPSMPTGYLYNRKWINRHCSGEPGNVAFETCLRNTRVILIGDSTVRQMFMELRRRLSCDWLTGAGMKHDKSVKHRPAICVNRTLNYTLEMEEHTLPFCTADTPRTYLRTFAAHLDLIRGNEKTIVVLHVFAHFLNHHSHVFYETLQNMKKGIVELLKRKPNAFIVIKGPHTFSFARNEDSVMWMPDRYADVYQRFIYDTFSDLKDRVMYLECQDITISTEQWHIHAEEYIVNSLVANVFSHACPY